MNFRQFMMALFAVSLLFFQTDAMAAAKKKKKRMVYPAAGTQLESFDPIGSENRELAEAPAEPIGSDQILSSGDNEDDLEHFHTVSRRMGIDLGMMIPFGDFANDFTYAPMIGFHFAWEAITPLQLLVEMRRASSPQKAVPANAKLSVNTISVGTLATFGMKRFSPFVKLAGSLHFNDVSFNDGRRITSGNDFNLTTIGLNAGIGVDFVVGREVAVGLDITYYYAVPKKLQLTDASNNVTTFDLGSPYALVGLRVNF